MQKVCIVIPFYNGDEYIEACLKSLSVGSCAQAGKIVVNNSDKPTNLPDIAGSYGNVTVIDAKPRIGFGRACNEGAKIAVLNGARYIIILNQDCVVHEDLVSQLIAPFEESAELVLTAPIHYDFSFSSIESFFISHHISTCPELFYDALNQQIKIRYKLDYVSGACFAIRSDFIERFGLFDPIYFMYGEDDDLCRRIKYLNYDIALIPRAKIGHHNQAKDCSNERYRHTLVRHSKSIYYLKDIKAPFVRSCLKVFYRSIKYYPRRILSFNIPYISGYLTGDINLLINLPRIIRSRNAEMSLVRKQALSRASS